MYLLGRIADVHYNGFTYFMWHLYVNSAKI
jgi:hypothetical protein